MTGFFTGAIIYADDVTFITPTCYILNSMLNVYEKYSLSHDILFNSLFSHYSLNLNPPPIYYMNTKIEYMNEYVLLRIHISNDLSDKNVFHTMHSFYRKYNELRYDFK